MIEYLSGEIGDLQPALAVIDCQGVGYGVNISLLDYTSLQGQQRAKLYVHEIIRDDAHDLYGFLTKDSRELFRLLISVSGVGPNTARMIMSALPASQIKDAVVTGNHAIFKGVKGIGAKTAQRIIVDLRDKMDIEVSDPLMAGQGLGAATASSNFSDTLAALTTLGFPPQASQKVLRSLFAQHPDISTEEALKKALTMF